VAVQGVPLDEVHAKRRPQHVEWVQTALALGRWCLRWGACGPRTPDTAAALLQVVGRG
jgi:hypothetical protein